MGTVIPVKGPRSSLSLMWSSRDVIGLLNEAATPESLSEERER